MISRFFHLVPIEVILVVRVLSRGQGSSVLLFYICTATVGNTKSQWTGELTVCGRRVKCVWYVVAL